MKIHQKELDVSQINKVSTTTSNEREEEQKITSHTKDDSNTQAEKRQGNEKDKTPPYLGDKSSDVRYKRDIKLIQRVAVATVMILVVLIVHFLIKR